MLGHITLKYHIIIKSSIKRSPVGFLLKSTGNWLVKIWASRLAFSPD